MKNIIKSIKLWIKNKLAKFVYNDIYYKTICGEKCTADYYKRLSVLCSDVNYYVIIIKIDYILQLIMHNNNKELYADIASRASSELPDRIYRFSSSDAYDYLSSINITFASVILSNSVPANSDFDLLINAIKLNNKQEFITIAGMLKDFKMHNACRNARESDQYDDYVLNEKWENSQGTSDIVEFKDRETLIYEMKLNFKVSAMLYYKNSPIWIQQEFDRAISDPIFAAEFDDSLYTYIHPSQSIDAIEASKIKERESKDPRTKFYLSEGGKAMQRIRLNGSAEVINNVTNTTKVFPTIDNPFRSMLIGSDEERDAIIANLSKYIDGKKKVAGAGLAQLVIAANELRWLITPDNTDDFHRKMVNTFGDKLGVPEALRKNLNEYEIFVRLLDSDDYNNRLYNKVKVNRRRINDIKTALMKIEEQQ